VFWDDLVSAYKQKDQGEGFDNEGHACTVQNEDYPEYFGSEGVIVNGTCVQCELVEDAKPRRPSKDAQSHDQKMEIIYEQLDAELRDSWRR
jgi:hypothetical protein